jgi:hypothetical protein
VGIQASSLQVWGTFFFYKVRRSPHLKKNTSK